MFLLLPKTFINIKKQKEESFEIIEEQVEDENMKSVTRKIPSPKLIIKEDKGNERKSKRRFFIC